MGDQEILGCRRCGKVGMAMQRKDRYSRGMFYLVTCHDDLCWAGPQRRTREEAIEDWNKLMEVNMTLAPSGGTLCECCSDACDCECHQL